MKDFGKELIHYAKGQTKKNAKYKSRKMVNGRWYYDYGDKKSPYRAGANAYAKNHGTSTNSNYSIEIDTDLAKLHDINAQTAGRSNDSYEREKEHYMANRAYSAAESAKRQQNSWQRKFNEKHYNYKSIARFNKAKAKGKALVKNLISKIYSE